jgi:FdhE protein
MISVHQIKAAGWPPLSFTPYRPGEAMTITEKKIAALKQAAVTSPEYGAITPLFLAIYEYVSGKEAQTGISLCLPEAGCAGRLTNGFPLLAPGDVVIDHEMLKGFLLGVVAVLAEHGKGADDSLDKIATALTEGTIDIPSLILAILERRRPPLDEAAASLDVPPPLLEYLFEIPLKTALEQYAATVSTEMVAGWNESLCPVCGSRPGMSELSGEEGKRVLSCSTCFFKWLFKRIKCPSCGSEDAGSFSYFTAGDGPTRVDTCKACSRYIKTRDARKGNADVPLEVEDLLTIHLDLLASKEGFERGK